MKSSQPRVRRPLTRARALRLMTSGADPKLFLNHQNKNVKRRALHLIARSTVSA